jgi:hypothetical protein
MKIGKVIGMAANVKLIQIRMAESGICNLNGM